MGELLEETSETCSQDFTGCFKPWQHSRTRVKTRNIIILYRLSQQTNSIGLLKECRKNDYLNELKKVCSFQALLQKNNV